ncbi:hypothetical protein ABN584_11570 [Gloeocapsa sp. BRSZ]
MRHRTAFQGLQVGGLRPVSISPTRRPTADVTGHAPRHNPPDCRRGDAVGSGGMPFSTRLVQ